MIDTIVIATVLLVLCAVALSIGYLLTGKQKLHKKCGSPPESKKGASCGAGKCSHCSSPKE